MMSSSDAYSRTPMWLRALLLPSEFEARPSARSTSGRSVSRTAGESLYGSRSYDLNDQVRVSMNSFSRAWIAAACLWRERAEFGFGGVGRRSLTTIGCHSAVDLGARSDYPGRLSDVRAMTMIHSRWRSAS